MSVMSIRPETPERRLTVDDLENTPDDGRRYELVDGRLDVSPAPKPWHSRADSRLTPHLGNQVPDELSVITGPGIVLNGDPGKHRIPRPGRPRPGTAGGGLLHRSPALGRGDRLP